MYAIIRWVKLNSLFQNHPPEVFYEKNVFLKFRKFHRKTPVRESFLKYVTF